MTIDVYELKRLIDNYIENIPDVGKDEFYETNEERAKDVLYGFLHTVIEQTPEYRRLVNERERLQNEFTRKMNQLKVDVFDGKEVMKDGGE